MRMSRERSGPVAQAGLALVVACVVLAPACALAQGRQRPQPPPRPANVGQPQPPPATPAGPAGGAGPAASAPATVQAPLDPDHPPVLPAASRAKMRECGRAWEALKKAGKDVDIGWRAYATDCLTR